MSYSQKCFASGRQSLNSEYVRHNISYTDNSGFFFALLLSVAIEAPSVATDNSQATALNVVTLHYFCMQWK